MRAQAPGLRVVEIVAPSHVLAQRLAARAREDAAGRESQLGRRVDTPVEAELVLINDGELQRRVDALLQWWQSLPDV